VLPYDRSAAHEEQGGPLFFPRAFQGSGRHDNPDLYGCVYASAVPLSVVVESLAPFRGAGDLRASMLRRAGRALALAELELDERAELLDLDNPSVLQREGLRPSQVATRRRATTQPQAAQLFEGHAGLGALLWWSTLEASWQNVTVFDRAAGMLSVAGCDELRLGDPLVEEAARFLGLAAA
jgi:hypothetical protein